MVCQAGFDKLRRPASRLLWPDRATVARPAHCLDQAVARKGLERLAEPADVDVHRALLDIDVSAPDPIQHLAPRVHALGVLHEELQQTILGWPERHCLVACRHPMARGIERQATRLDRSAAARRRRPPQHGVDPRQQFARAERLRDVVVGTSLETRDLVVLIGPRGEHDHRQVLSVLVALDRAGEFEAALVRQHPVDQHQVRAMVGNTGAGARAVLGLAHVEASATQPEGDHVANGFLVLDDQYLLAGHDASTPGGGIAAELRTRIMTFQ